MKHCCFRYDYDPSGDTLNVIPDFTPNQARPSGVSSSVCFLRCFAACASDSPLYSTCHVSEQRQRCQQSVQRRRA